MRNLNYQTETEHIQEWIAKQLWKAEAKGLLVGLSGGVDSSVVTSLCVGAVGSQRVLGLIMPEDFTPKQDTEDAMELAEKLTIETRIIAIHSLVQAFRMILPQPEQTIPIANLRARLRMCILYHFANSKNYLVVGTGDRSESLLGYFTKYGDGGVDMLPIGHLYKTEVRELGRTLGLPEKLCNKPSSPQLYQGHQAIDELPGDYATIDPIMEAFFDGYRLDNMDKSVLDEVARRFLRNEHKRAMPPIPKVS